MTGILEHGEEIEVELHPSTVSIGDLVVFKSRSGNSVKQVFGVVGSSIKLDGSILMVQNQGILIKNESQRLCWEDWSKMKNVPEGYIVVFGTRDDSVDSRQLGFIPIENIVGKVLKDK